MNNQTLRCACLLMQRNESELLEPWIQYHGALFGYENLYIFDNGSDNPKAKRILREYENTGVHVDYQFSRSEDYPDKGKILTDCAQSLNETGEYDFFFPLDCDEFLALRTEDEKVSCNFDQIKNYLSSVPSSDTTYHVIRNYLNIIGYPEYFQEHSYSKVFFSSRLIVALDHGSHLTSSSVNVTPSDIVYIHCHAKPFATVLAHSRDKLRPWVDVDSSEALDEFETNRGIGWHLVKYLRMSEIEYLNLFKKENATYIPDFPNKLKELGCSINFLTGSRTEMTTRPTDRTSVPNILHLNAVEHPDDNTIILMLPRLSMHAASITGNLLSLLGFETLSAGLEIEEGHTVQSALQAGLWEKLRKFSIARTEKNRHLAITGFSAEDLTLIQHLPVEGLRCVIALQEPMSPLTGHGDVVTASARHLISRQENCNTSLLQAAFNTSLETLLLDESIIRTDPHSLVAAFMEFLGPDFECDLDPDTIIRKLQYDTPLKHDAEFSFYEGWIDSISDSQVSGWCWRKGSDLPQVVALIIDEHIVDVGLANTFREDLLRAGIGCGSFGFHLTLPEGSSFSSDRIQVRILKDNVRLKSSVDS